MRLVLASQSPSRRAILRGAGVDPVLHPAHVDEDALRAALPPHATPGEVVAHLARAKALAIAGEHAGDVVVGCDSMLLLDGQLQGKPHTEAETVRRWKAQAGRTAELLTGHCVVGPGGNAVVDTARTGITFARASEADIAAYAATGESWECAGAFTLEALGGWFVDRIEGDPSSVIGLSLPLLRRALYSFGLTVSDFWES
ncbi:Maf family protein [Corynebacterium mastitidis]|uniref:Maf family protein n=1 Tax=Corynebacterium mastitidis TaxID=161890 RepID=UPI00036C6D55|nr:nucleoside triphosphate pyrophosphatase [Corynebacterium mastitidis]